ncbi:MAG: hypothetical protein GY711_34715 [bacterium]|nr:hypothetical protein [bacterium]
MPTDLPTGSEDPDSLAERIYADVLASVEYGAQPDIDELCARHAGVESELRRS